MILSLTGADIVLGLLEVKGSPSQFKTAHGQLKQAFMSESKINMGSFPLEESEIRRIGAGSLAPGVG